VTVIWFTDCRKGGSVTSRPKWREKPLSWWSNARRHFGYNSGQISVSLGRLYQLIFNEELQSLAQVVLHGADVQMTIRLIDAYFRRTQGSPIPGKIEAFFQLKPSRGMTTELEHQVEVIDAECRDRVSYLTCRMTNRC
jgi:hypothetical protein